MLKIFTSLFTLLLKLSMTQYRTLNFFFMLLNGFSKTLDQTYTVSFFSKSRNQSNGQFL